MNAELKNITRYNKSVIKDDEQYQAAMQVYDCLYKGVDLEVKFADEIAAAGNVYKWLENRKNAGNYEGIHVGDYFHTNIKAGIVGATEKYDIKEQTFTCRIVGINTYKNCHDIATGNMIYFNSDEVVDTLIQWSPSRNNNGTADEHHPWLASAAYAVLNGVNNYSTNSYNKAAHGANCSSGGILQLLPAELQAVIKQKRNILDQRYSESGLLTGGTAWDFLDMGKLWLPNEIEVHGCGIRSNLCSTSGFWFPESGIAAQFPWYANSCERRVKKQSNGTRIGWWLSSVETTSHNGVCSVSNACYASRSNADYNYIGVPLCFCI